MRALKAGALALVAGAAGAEVKDEEYYAGDQLVQIEVFDGTEIMWVGPNQYERTQVLSGPDIEILAEMTDDEALQMLGVRALVAVQPGTHSCENLGNPLAYHVVTLGAELATDGPLTTCVELTVSLTPGAILLEEDPMGEGESYTWVPRQGFGGAAN
ncbi:hypothetical protein [Rhodobacter sp. SY28-1]|uniref:hypothetical protein n=1 Tax=Rhodobacter sp. SY28-1 TaxID=2562317 RepID=UPI0010C0BA06|nr:hypothetical protein [Rhodobacter sp. SY28-1]